MDDVRIEKLSEKLHNARIDGRIGTAKNLLSKMKMGILNADAPCMGKLVDDIHKSLEFIVQDFADPPNRSPDMFELLGLLLSLLKSAAVDPTKITDTASKILEQLYLLKNTENLNGVLQKSLEETIDTICGLNQTTSTRYAAQVHQEQRALELALTSNISESAARDAFAKSHTSMFHGAGAILNLPLAYNGWKFPHFVLTERDERWLFDVDVRVKLQHECAARDLWAVLADLPAPAILLKTNLLHSVIDLIGAPFSRTDAEADPQGLHPLTALRWLERLLNKCRHAFRVQLDGTLCSRTPHHDEFLYRNNSHHDGEGAEVDAPDLAGKLAQAMYALRHPLLPTPPNTDNADSINVYLEALHNRQQTPIGTLSALFPTPSYPGLAFSCCAASLPLLQTRDTTVARAVLSMLRASLPYVLEPRLLGGNSGRLLDVERGRLQHLLNRVEQLLAFFGDAFQLDAYLTLMYSEDPSSDDEEGSDGASPASSAHAQQAQAAQRAQARKEQADTTLETLQTSSFDLSFLTAVVEVLRAVPVWALQPAGTASDCGLTVGALTQACICRLVASAATIEALLPGCAEVAHSCLEALDVAMLGRIQATSRILQSAKVFTSRTLPDEAVSQLLPRLVAQLDDCVSLLDAGCPVALPATQSAIAVTLPILLQASEQYAQKCDYDQATPLLALICRVLSCGDDTYKTRLLEHLLMWCTKSTLTLRTLGTHGAAMFADAQIKLIRAFELGPATGRQTVPLLATPQMVQCLLSTYLTSTAPDSALAGAAVDLLEVLCEHFMNRGIANHLRNDLNSGGASEWVTLLLPMKALEWEMERVDGAQCSFIAFARELQDACADSCSPAVRAAFARSLVVGLFHSTSAVRINSALRVRRDLLGISPFAGPENSELRFGVQAYDPFPANSSGGLAMRLSDWATDAADGSTLTRPSKGHTAKAPATSAFTHADLRKIASIGLGELDASTRATALERVAIMLDSDTQLQLTVDADWCASTLRSALQQLSMLAPIAPNTVTCDADRMQALSDAECRLFTETARLVGFLCTHFAFLRKVVCYHHAADEPHSPPTSILLRVLLSAHQLKKANTSAYDAVQRVAAISAQVLCLLACNTESWPLSEVDAVKHQYVSADGAEVRSTSLCMPAHVIRRFLFPASVNAANEYSKMSAGSAGKSTVVVGGVGNGGRGVLCQIVQVSLHCAPTKPAQYPADDIVRLLVAETATQSVDRIHVATATKLFGLINEARNHTHMRETLSSALCLFQANPALLHVFVCLRMSLVTALSSIATVNPCTHKDHVTLCTTLDFLHHTFRSLHRSCTGAARLHISESLYSDIIDVCNEAYSAVLPSMAAYFAEHFAQANTFFVSLTGIRETDKEHAAAAHAVCTAYFRLLHTLSSFSDPRLQLGVVLSGHYVTALLVHMAGSEMHSAYDRSVALSILENLLRNHVGGWEAVCCVENPETAVLGGNYQKPTKIAQLKSKPTKRHTSAADISSGADFDVVDCLVRIVKLVRTPDSVQGTASVTGALRLLYLSLLQRRQSSTLAWTLTESEAQWKWLVRLMYDRHSEVKVLAVEILGLALKQITVADLGTTATSIDSLAQTAPAVHSTSVTDAAAVPAAPSVEVELLHWPPFELLGHLVTDSTESTALRTRAIDILVHSYTEQPALRALMKPTFKLAAVMAALFECLAVKDSDHATTASIRSALSALTKLLSTRDDSLLQDVLQLTRTMKLMPQVVELLNIRVQGSLNLRALARVSVYDDEYISRERTYFHSDALSLRAAAASMFELQGAGWQALQSEVRTGEADGMRNGRAAACWLFFHLRSADPALFEECVDHSNLVYHLISCFSSVAEPISASSVYGFEFECASISAQAELLSLLISQDAAARPADSAGLLEPAPIGALYAYVQANDMVPSNVLKKMVLILLNIMDFDIAPKDAASSRTLQQLHCISSCLRLLSLMLNEAHWRDLLGLGGPQENTTMSNPCAYMFDMLLSLRKLLTNLAASSTSAGQNVTLVAALLSRLDVTMALFMQYSYEARVLFVQHSVQHQLAAAEAQRPSAQDKSIFRQHIDTVVCAVEFLNTPAPQTQPQASSVSAMSTGASSASVVSAATPTFSASGPLTPEAKRSLQSIKAKATTPCSKTAGSAMTPGSVAASPSAAAGRPPVNQSMSSWATKTSQSSKWRDKSRSYAWNKDRSDSAKQNRSVAPEMPDSMKLQLWSALTVLSAALPNCESAVDWASDLKLHHSLSRLLRFTAKYSVATLVSSNTHISSAACAAVMSDDLWVPSNGMLASAISALCCAFTYHHTHAKQCFASTGDAAAAVLGGTRAGKSAATASTQSQQGQGGTALHQLISVGISRSFVPVTRWLCLSMAGSLLSGARSLGTPTLKSTFSQIVALSLQRSLHSAHSDPDAVVPLLNTLASFLSTEEDLTHLTQLCKKDQSAMLRNFQLAQGLVKEHSSVEDFKLITFPELMQWVWSAAGARNDVAAALCRCLGRISLVDKSHRTVGNLLSDAMLSVLCECYNTYTHPCVNTVSALSLWHIVHNSEKAKVMVRELMLQSPSSVAAEYPYNKAASNAGPSKAARVLFGTQQDDQQLPSIQEDDYSGGSSQEEPVARAKCFIDSLCVV